MARGGRDSLDDQLGLLARLMKSGRELALSDLIEGDGGRRDAVSAHLARLAKHLPTLVSGRRTPTGLRYQFHWPEAAQVNPHAVLAIRLAHRLLAAFGESGIGDELSRMVVDLDARSLRREQLPPDLSRLFFAKSRMLSPLGADPNVLEQVAKAAMQAHLIEFDYTTWSAKTPHLVVEPWSVVFADEGIYVLGMTRESSEEKYASTRRIYNIVRVRNLVVRTETFTYPNREKYDPEVVFRHSIGIFVREDDEAPEQVVVRFDRRWAPYLAQNRWHASQSDPVDVDEGRVEVTFTLLITQELSRWLRGFGKDIEIREPALLRTWVESGEDP